jgi:hypothetical protein
MKYFRSVLTLLATVVFVGLVAHAQATRTWVSGVGDDANPCSRTAPCKTFAGAISKTAAGGEIDALDPGGFGQVTISKSITIDGGGGQVASVLASGSPGIIVNAGTTDIVTLRNLSIQGGVTTSTPGTIGVNFVAGNVLHIEHCVIAGFTQNGINIVPGSGASPQVFIEDTRSEDNLQNGLNIVGTGGMVHVNVANSHFSNNTLNGVFSSDYSNTAVTGGDANGNLQSGYVVIGNLGAAKLSIVNSMAANNNVGVTAGGGAQTAAARVANVALFSNPTGGFSVGANGTISSFGNNYNAGAGTPSGTIAPQ